MARPGPYQYRSSRRRPSIPKNAPEPIEPVLVVAQNRWIRRKRIKRVSWRDEEIVGMSLTTTRSVLADDDDRSSEGGGGGGPGGSDGSNCDIIDPAIVVRGNVVARSIATSFYTYSRDRLFEIRDFPLSKIRPSFLDNTFLDLGRRTGESGYAGRKTPNDEGSGRGDGSSDSHTKRRSGDPRERIRKEQDGIVLSPQRRSFNLGCSAPLVAPGSVRRPESPLGGKTELMPVPRRIGSGRIVTRDVSWDYKADPPSMSGNIDDRTASQEYSFRPGGGSQMQRDRRENERDERFERRSFGREYDRDKDRHQTRNGRFGNDRRRAPSESKDDEPEWFSGGPTSQTDTIELRGFEDIPEERNTRRQKQSPPTQPKKKSKEKEQRKSVSNDGQTKEESPPKVSSARSSTPTKEDIEQVLPEHSPIEEHDSKTESNENEKSIKDKSMSEPKLDEKSNKMETKSNNASLISNAMEQSSEFILEDFLKMDTIPMLLTNGVESRETTGSRFSRWFQRDSPPPVRPDSRRSSIQDELINNLINDITEPNVTIPRPGESDAYFAPISPAGPLQQHPQGQSDKPITLMEMLQRATGKQKPQPAADVPAKVLSLEEIEANIRQNMDKTGMVHGNMSHGLGHQHFKPDDDMTAFKQLLAKVTGGQAIPATNGPGPQKPQPLSILQMLTKSQQQDETAARNANQNAANIPPQIPPELVMKLHQVQQNQRQQQQQEILAKLMQGGVGSSGRPYQASPLPSDMLGAQMPNVELLQRPEAQAIIQGLKRGEITPQHLMQQLANPAIQPRHREMIMCIVKLCTGGAAAAAGGLLASPRAVSPLPPPDMQLQQFLFQQQQLRVSPLPPNAMPQRIPSPRELQAHTQSIMQQALIKKKLVEQRENFRKKQELAAQRASSPAAVSPAKHVASPTPHSFTPTSVLRKMTATKDPEPNTVTKDKSLSSNMSNNMMNSGDHNQNKNSQQNSVQIPLPQGRAVTGMRQSQQPQQQQQIPHGWPGQTGPIKQQGRPILKGNNYQQYNVPSVDYQQQQQQQQRGMGQHITGSSNIYQQMQAQQQRSKMNTSFIPPPGMHRPISNNLGGQNNAARAQQLQLQMAQMHQRTGLNPTLQQLLQMQGSGYVENRGIPITGRNANSGGLQFSRTSPQPGELSPTSNQLARWFSPELLAQARAGKLPDMPPVSLAQNARSLEELERMQQAAAAVHN